MSSASRVSSGTPLTGPSPADPSTSGPSTSGHSPSGHSPSGPVASGSLASRSPASAGNRSGGTGPLARAARLVWLWPALLTLALGLYGCGRVELWRDELATWNAIDRSPSELLHLLENVDAVTGVYYLFIQQWTTLFGHSLVMFRLPSMLAMAGAAAFVALTARKLFDTRTALVAGLLFALIPSVSRYAQEARGYAFVVLAVSAATFLLLRALERPTAGRWALYAVSVCTAGIFHMISLVFLASHALIVLLRWRTGRERRLLTGFALWVVIALLPLLPLAVLGRRQVGRQLDWLDRPTLQYVADVFWRGLFGSTWISLIMLALAVLPLAWSRGRRPAYEIGAVAVLPILMLWTVSQGSTPYFLDRYLLFTLPAWAVLAAAGLAALRPKAFLALGLVAVLVLCVHGERSIRKPFSRENFDAKTAAAVIAEGYEPGDGLAPLRGHVKPLQYNIALGYYLPENVHLKDVFVAKSAVELGDLYPQLCTDPAACIGDLRRVWVVTEGSPDSNPFSGFSPAERKALTQAFPKRTVTPVPGMTVTLLER
ncbi:glycosyltransferase family 39 protein [Streptomyces sp. NPDC091268]|uniref:glycosyltransferase family 39 protein n=1 Tax=Streptomyces sp. NPDC091268 TaxID=3365979 RepID=UPI003826892B